MNSSKILATAAALLVTGVAASANATFVADKTAFTNLLVNPTVIDFEGVAPHAGSATMAATAFSNLGVTFSSNGGYYDQAFTSTNLPNPAPSDWACTPCVRGTPLTISFSNQVQSLIDGVGFNVAVGGPGYHPGQVDIDVFNGNTLLASGIFAADNFTNFGTYVGVYGLGAITSVVITPLTDVNGLHQLGIDNLAFGDPPGSLAVQIAQTPEPATILMLGLGLGGLGLVRRRRTTQS